MARSHESETPDITSSTPSSKIVRVQFDRYTITVKLGEANEFLGITEVAVSQDFRSLQQKLESTGSHDVSDYYDLES